MTACSDADIDPEEQIRRQLKSFETFAEDRDADSLMDYVSPDYRDNRGLDYRKVNTLLRLRLLRSRGVHIFTRITSIELESVDHAEAVIYAGISRTAVTDGTNVEDTDIDLVRVRLMLARDDDKWMVDSSSWVRASVDELFY